MAQNTHRPINSQQIDKNANIAQVFAKIVIDYAKYAT